MTVPEARARLAGGYYNSNARGPGNPGGLASGGHQINFPQALIDLGAVLIQAAVDAGALSAAQPSIAAAVAAVASAQQAASQALQYRNEAEQIVGTDLSGKANINSPALTGTPTAPTPAQSDNSNRLATSAYVRAAISALVNGSGAALDTLQELAAALGNDPNFATTIAAQIAAKLDKAGGNLSGDLYFPNAYQGERRIVFNVAAGRGIYLYGNQNAVGLFDSAANSVWQYAATTGQLDLKAGVTAGGAGIYTTNNLSPVDLPSYQTITGRKEFITANTSMGGSTLSSAALEVRGSGGAALIAFHRPGSTYTYFGIDSDGVLKLGNSAGQYVSWNSGNDGSGSGLDADMTRGAIPDTAATPNTLAKRDGTGALTVAGLASSQDVTLASGRSVLWPTHGGGFYMSDATWIRTVNNKGIFAGSGRMSAAGYDITSDRRLKSEVTPLLDVGALVDQLGVYAYLKGGRREWGVIAQELAAEPRLAHLVGDTGEAPAEGEAPLMTVDPNGLLALALAELKGLRVRVAQLEAER